MEFNNSEQVLQQLHETEYEEFFVDDLGVFVYLLILCFVGTFGNIHTLIIYYLSFKPSNHRTFILWLAAVDLMACAVGIPFEIFDVRYRYTFIASWCCKIFRFVNHIASVGSGLLLGVIALERFRKACQPMKDQMSGKQAMIACFTTVSISIILSIPAFFLYGSNTVVTDFGMVGIDCTALGSLYTYFKVYSGLLLFLTTIVFIMCIVVYCCVGKVLYRQLKYRKAIQLRKQKKAMNGSVFSLNKVVNALKNQHTLGSTLSLDNISTDGGIIQDDESSYNDHLKINPVKGKKSGNTRKRIGFDRSKRITLMFLVATTVSYMAYLPNTVILVIKALHKEMYNGIVHNLGGFALILLRLYFISNITNPIVYSFMDERFRSECKHFYERCKDKVMAKFR